MEIRLVGPPAQPEAASVGPAGFWVRAGALALDAALVTAAVAAVKAAFRGTVGLNDTGRIALELLVLAVYFTLPVALWGRTPGKAAAGLKVVGGDGGRVGPWRALGRAAALLPSVLLLGLGCVPAAFTQGKRALHDYAAGTFVVVLEGTSPLRLRSFAALGAFAPLAAAFFLWARIPSDLSFDAGGQEGVSRLMSWDEGIKRDHSILITAWALYVGDHDGKIPAAPDALVPDYLQEIPALRLPEHPLSAEVTLYGKEACAGDLIDGDAVRDSGTWGYVADAGAPCAGTVFVDCKHLEPGGRPWFAYLETADEGE